MTDNPADNTRPVPQQADGQFLDGQPDDGQPLDGRPVEAAITAALAANDSEALMRAVAGSEVVVPQAPGGAGGDQDGSISLPVVEQDGTSYVPVFTSEVVMTAAAPDIEDSVTVPAAALGANWPSDDLWMAVNPGTEDGLTLPPDAVRSLPVYNLGQPEA